MLLIHSSRSTKERTGHRSWKLLLAGIILPGLCLALFWHSASVSAAVINDPSEYPNVGTSDTFTPGGSNFDGNPNIGAAAMINNISGAASYLYQKDGTKSYDTYDAGKVPIPNTCGNQLGYPTVGNNICWWAQRSEGGILGASHFEIVTNQLTASAGVDVTIVDACKAVGDSVGWEDHMSQAPNSNGGGVDGISATANGQGPANCGNAGRSGNNLLVHINPGSFDNNAGLKHFGSGMTVAFITVDDGSINNSEKVFSLLAPNLVYVGPADASADGAGAGFTNLENPGADYKYLPPGPCLDSTNHATNSPNCPGLPGQTGGYSSMNVNSNSPNNYTFYFQPDCSYQKNPYNVTLLWRNGKGTNTTQNDPESWKLTDMSTGQSWPVNNINGGSQTIGSYLTTGHTYKWAWTNVDRAHGISVQLPFSEFTATGGFQNGSNCVSDDAICSWLAVDYGPGNPAQAVSNGGAFNSSKGTVYISMRFNNTGGTSWPANTYGIRYVGGSSNPLFNSVGPGSSYVIYGDNHPGTLAFNDKGDASDTYAFQMYDSAGNLFGSRCQLTINWPGSVGIFTCSRFEMPNNDAPPASEWGTVPASGVPTNSYFRVTVLGNVGEGPTGGPALNSAKFGAPANPSPNNIGRSNSMSPGNWATWPADGWSWRANAPGGSPANGKIWQVGLDSPTGQDRKVYVEYWQFQAKVKVQTGTDKAGNPIYSTGPGYVYHYYYQQIVNCYSATCSISISPDGIVPGSPTQPNPMQASQGFWATVTEHNTGWDQLPDAGFVPPNGGPDIVSFITTGWDGGVSLDNLNQDAHATIPGWYTVWGGGTRTAPNAVHFGAPGSEGTYTLTAQPEYNGNAWLGPPCAVTMNAYAYFSMTPTAGITSIDTENPDVILYQTGVNYDTIPNPPGSIRSSYTSELTGPAPGLPKIDSGTDNYPSPNVPYKYSFTVPPGTPVVAGTQYCASMTLSPANGWVWTGGGAQDIANPQSLTTQSTCPTIVDEPYVKVYGNGVSAAGGAMSGGACTGGQLTSWNADQNKIGNIGIGSGAQLSALATIAISGFASAQNTASYNNGTYPGQGLSFANNGPGVDVSGYPAYQDTPHMGGNYNSNFCLGEQKMPTSGATALGSIVSAGSLTGSAKYTAPANTRIDGGTIPANTNAAIYVNGDVYISGANGGISYSNAGWNWSTTNDTVPSFAVVAVGGNIYIDRNVTNLDGLYVAQKAGGNGGKIYDCTNGIGTANVVGVGSMFSDCNNQLVVHGNLVADQINLMRTLGSLRDSLKNPGETPRGPIGRTCSDGGVYKVCAGEVFDFSPELYLGKLQLTQSNNGATVYQAYTSLPPIL